MQLEVNDFSISLGDKTILTDSHFSINAGETAVISGSNGSGKSSFVKAVCGFDFYKMSGEVLLDGNNILNLDLAERSRLGFFLSYQEPIDIPGLSYAEMLRASLDSKNIKLNNNDFQLAIAKGLERLELDPFMAQKHIGCNLSGGEKKKMEVLQILVLKPSLVFLDEIDSGLDTKSASLVSKILSEYQQETNASFVVITHNNKILESLNVDKYYQIRNKKLTQNEKVS